MLEKARKSALQAAKASAEDMREPSGGYRVREPREIEEAKLELDEGRKQARYGALDNENAPDDEKLEEAIDVNFVLVEPEAAEESESGPLSDARSKPSDIQATEQKSTFVVYAPYVALFIVVATATAAIVLAVA